MSKNYKQAMDRIAVSDALKSRIMDAAEEKLAEGEREEKTDSRTKKTDSRAQKRSKVFYLRYAAGIAACAAICLTTVYLTKNLGMDGILPQLEEPPIQSEIEPPSKNEPSADKNTENTEGNSTEKPQTAPKSDEGLTDSKNTDTTGRSDSTKGQGGNITARPSSAAESGSGISDNSENTASGGKFDNSENTANNGKSDNSGNTAGSGKTDNTEGSASGGTAEGSENTAQGELPPKSENPMGGENPGTDPSNELSSALPPTETADIEELRRLAGYAFKMPTYVTEGYKIDGTSLILGELIQISYRSAEDEEINYRTEKGSGDISGDYNVYDTSEELQVGGNTVTVKGIGGKYYLAIWEDGESAYSLGMSAGADKAEMLKIIGSVAAVE